ncbi:MAG: hypothetical protein MPEBLZ_00870 [Candidatus Methanoperedens nitroreducens]|uniref:Uncharacterized protein n=1 Tax=Candidatus Methanoperedens nitratireducens TaxID=1392998 RepID=A0A0P8A8J3_9EURY|nr:MAG: hypothetical protein MPEBLZ_00870 [Candidatus Methanoperedens sp. BLZ1]MCX9087935.1 hypothetical protein [Candidatus Methanoperedens sp.]CAG1007126.1 hypothetical protein METP2_03833 [Methanosarcinales archaeon]
MTEVEASLCDQKNGHFSFEHNNIDIHDRNDSGNDSNNRLMLAFREERAALLKAGLTGKDIESLYLRINGIVVIGVSWQDFKS